KTYWRSYGCSSDWQPVEGSPYPSACLLWRGRNKSRAKSWTDDRGKDETRRAQYNDAGEAAEAGGTVQRHTRAAERQPVSTACPTGAPPIFSRKHGQFRVFRLPSGSFFPTLYRRRKTNNGTDRTAARERGRKA